jgi:hypothetical protein
MEFIMTTELKNVANAEWLRTAAEENVYAVIDGLGCFRNLCGAVGSAAELAVGATAAKVASIASGAIVPISFIVGGLFVMGSAAIHTIPKARDECVSAMSDLDIAMRSKDPVKREQRMDLADEGITAAALGLTNQSLYGMMGAGMVQCGVVTLMSPAGVSVFGGHALVSAGAAGLSGAALGAVYAVRGCVVLGKSIYALNYLNKFDKDFKKSLKLSGDATLDETVDNAIGEIKKIGALQNALGRRIGNNPQKPPGKGASLEDKISYLVDVDKGIQERKLQEVLGVIIGVAMILGGIAAIAAFFVCPAVAPIIALVSAVFFVLMESVYGTNDTSYLFGKLRDKLYKPSDEIVALQNASKRQKPRVPYLKTQAHHKALDLAIPKSLEDWATLNNRTLKQTSRIRRGGIHLIDLKETA